MPRTILVLVLITLAITGCASGGNPASPDTPAATTSSPVWSSTDLPTMARPTAPPEVPTDLGPPSNLIVGTITTGGTGPCYVLETDEGKQYALFGDTGRDLPRGTMVRVWFEPAASNCTPGTQVRIVKLERVTA